MNYKIYRIRKFLGEFPPIRLTKIIADMKRIHPAYIRRFMNVKPKT